VDGKLLLAWLSHQDADSDALQVELLLLDADGAIIDSFRTPARDAIGSYPGVATATLNRHVLLAWTTSFPGNETYRWTEVQAALLECQ
jgi:hypothetical protein